MSTYLITYSLSTDFDNVFYRGQFRDSIINNIIITTELYEISVIGDDINITFVSEPSNDEKTELDILVASHVPQEYVMTNIVFLSEKLPIGTNGGSFAEDTWVTRNLNTINPYPVEWCSLSNNKFTLTEGNYYIDASAPAYDVDNHQICLYNETDSKIENIGTSEYAKKVNNRSFLIYYLEIYESTTFSIKHQWTDNKGKSSKNYYDGLGRACGILEEIYCQVKIKRK